MGNALAWAPLAFLILFIFDGSGTCQASVWTPKTRDQGLSRRLLVAVEGGAVHFDASLSESAQVQGSDKQELDDVLGAADSSGALDRIDGEDASSELAFKSSSEGLILPSSVTNSSVIHLRLTSSEVPKDPLFEPTLSGYVYEVSKCDPAYGDWVEELRLGLQLNFTADVDEDYLQLMHTLQVSAASLCRVMFVQGSDPTLISFCVQHLPRFDAVTANIDLDLDRPPSEAACTAVNITCITGCGRCDDPGTVALANTVYELLTSDICGNHGTDSVDADFACALEAILQAQAQLSSIYKELGVGEHGSAFELDTVEFYQENVVLRDWVSLQGLSCSRR